MSWKQKVEFLKPNWPCPEGIFAISTYRLGGISEGPFKGFNLGDHVGDDAKVLEHRNYLEEAFQLNPIVWLNQVHGDGILDLDSLNPNVLPSLTPENLAYDASTSSSPKLTCAVMTADCLPVLITNKAGTCVAAVHCGWKSLAKGILAKTIQKLPAKPSELLVWLGPAIGPLHFEVGKDVQDIFCELDPHLISTFEPIPNKADKWLMDIYQAARMILNRAGVSDIYGGEYCTYSDPYKFYSYRRDKITGRMASIIALKK